MRLAARCSFTVASNFNHCDSLQIQVANQVTYIEGSIKCKKVALGSLPYTNIGRAKQRLQSKSVNHYEWLSVCFGPSTTDGFALHRLKNNKCWCMQPFIPEGHSVLIAGDIMVSKAS